MSSGFGIRTMSTDAAGYWPLSYHGGSVWTHDTAIIARGMALRGSATMQADHVVEGLLAAAEGFGFRVPELHSGDPAAETSTPTPYPAACRPQAWSAAAAVDRRAHRGARHGRVQSTLTTGPPVSRPAGRRSCGNTVCGVPPAAQISG